MLCVACSVTLFSQTTTGKNEKILIRFLTVGMCRSEGVVFGDKYWFIRLIQLLSTTIVHGYLFLPQIWYTGENTESPFCRKYQLVKECFMGTCRDRSKWKYYFYFGANNIYHECEVGGIGVAVADRPEGPFKDALGKPLIGKIVNGRNLLTSLFSRTMTVSIICITAVGDIAIW